jgi:geranylgeranyl reductase family protein
MPTAQEDQSLKEVPQPSLSEEDLQATWDVAVVGAGPAGATAAAHLGRKGRRVLLLDRAAFPREKVCGDGLIADAIACLDRLGVLGQVQAAGSTTSLTSIFSPSRVELTVQGTFMTLERSVLDGLIAAEAVRSGAVLRRARVRGLVRDPSGRVRLETAEGQQLFARSAVLATGADVELADTLGVVQTRNASAIAMRCYYRSDLPLDRLVISYDRSIVPGYAWIFPMGAGRFNVGCGVFFRNGAIGDVNLRKILDTFMSGFPIARELAARGEAITPLRGAKLRCGLRGCSVRAWDNLLVAGESAGTTFPFTGEGIGKAMETGELAAAVLDNALRAGDFSSTVEFEKLIDERLRPKFLGYEIAERWLGVPWLNDFVARRALKSKFLRDALQGVLNETVDPRAVFSARGMVRSFLS